jgi:tRNA modification GTPase
MFSPTDTIVAIATPPGRGGIGVVRVSGPDARKVAAGILATRSELTARVATFTRVVAPVEGAATGQETVRPATALRTGEAGAPANMDGAAGATAGAELAPPGGEDAAARAIDQVVATLFPAPASYTGEDVVEISAHGSPVVLQAIASAAMAAGARLAEPGEFTLRAFLNGRLDLVQAEAVADLVNAVTPLQARAAFDQLEGTLTGAIGRIDAALFDLVARLEASIDFPDEGYHFIAPYDIETGLHRVAMEIEALVRDARRGRIVREGRQVVVAGKANVGKSTLFNRLLGAERAIVTPVAGTTRDLVTETVDLQGVRVCLVDTAGVRNPDDAVEREGVARAVGAAAIADVVLLVLDRSRPLDDDDWKLLASSATSDRLVVINKCDLAPAWTTAGPEPGAGAAGQDIGGRAAGAELAAPGLPGRRARGWLPEGAVEISLETGNGVAELKHRLAERLLGAERLRDVPAVTNVRHIDLLVKAGEAIGRAQTTLADSRGEVPEEFLLSDLEQARGALEEVTGKRTSEDLLRHIFGRFCVGK